SSPVTHGATDVAYSYAATAADPDAGDILSFALLTAPAGMTIESASGLVQWTPTSSQLGVSDVVVRVRDVHGLFALQGFSVSVTAPVAVPDVVGQSTSSAEGSLVAAQLAVGGETNRNSPTAPANTIISQSPAAGALVAPATPVALVVSTGRAPTGTVPDV